MEDVCGRAEAPFRDVVEFPVRIKLPPSLGPNLARWLVIVDAWVHVVDVVMSQLPGRVPVSAAVSPFPKPSPVDAKHLAGERALVAS